jgi:chorismate mutase
MTIKKPVRNILEKVGEIDNKIHDLLMERTNLITSLNQDAKVLNILSLGREASMIKKIVERHDGKFPLTALTKIFREIFCSAVSIDGDFNIAIYSNEGNKKYIGLAKEYFGSNINYSGHGSLNQVINAVVSEEANLGVISCYNESNISPWWTAFDARSEAIAPRIVAKLPFLASEDETNKVQAYVVSMHEQEVPENSNTLFSVEASQNISSSTLVEIFENKGFKGVKTHSVALIDEMTKSFLIEVENAIKEDDVRLVEIVEEKENIDRLIIIGAYAKPIKID